MDDVGDMKKSRDQTDWQANKAAFQENDVGACAFFDESNETHKKATEKAEKAQDVAEE